MTQPAGRTTQPAQGTTQPAQGTTQPDRGTTQPDRGTTQPAGRTTRPARGTTRPAGGTQVRPGAANKRLAPALARYRLMAYVTGCFLLLLCTEMAVKYGLRGGQPWAGDWVAIVHGWIYVVYLVTVVDLWSKLRWRFGRLVALVLAGVVPLLSFFAEHRTTGEVRRLMAERGEG